MVVTKYGDVVYRPVDRRENYVKRLVGMPGETLQIIDRKVLVDGKELPEPQYLQHFYLVLSKNGITDNYWRRELGIYTKGNGSTLSPDVYQINDPGVYDYLGIKPDSVSGQYKPLYQVNMTREMVAKLEKSGKAEWVREMPLEWEQPGQVYPQRELSEWTSANFGPIWIPRRGASIKLTDENVELYGRCIRSYEQNLKTGEGQGNELIRTGKDSYELNGEPAKEYTFQMDYYWMMGDNRDNSLDSRFWGFVPEDHIVGTPLFVWFSIDQETGEWRKDRWFKQVKGL